MLEVRDLRAGYGESRVLFGVDLDVAAGQVVTLLGRNGMGKTTTVWSIMGELRRTGSIRFEGRDIGALESFRVCQAGIALVPEGRRIFPNLTVRENLVVAAANRRHLVDAWNLPRVLDLFPSLAARIDNYGNQLSGGEQQLPFAAETARTIDFTHRQEHLSSSAHRRFSLRAAQRKHRLEGHIRRSCHEPGRSERASRHLSQRSAKGREE